MEMIVGKIEQLYNEMVSKDLRMEKDMEQIKKEAIIVEKRNQELIKLSAELAEQQKKLKSFKDFEAEKKKVAEKVKDNTSRALELDKKEVELNKLSDELSKITEEQKAKKEALNKQALALKDREAEFDVKRKELKDIISGKAVKELLK